MTPFWIWMLVRFHICAFEHVFVSRSSGIPFTVHTFYSIYEPWMERFSFCVCIGNREKDFFFSNSFWNTKRSYCRRCMLYVCEENFGDAESCAYMCMSVEPIWRIQLTEHQHHYTPDCVLLLTWGQSQLKANIRMWRKQENENIIEPNMHTVFVAVAAFAIVNSSKHHTSARTVCMVQHIHTCTLRARLFVDRYIDIYIYVPFSGNTISILLSCIDREYVYRLWTRGTLVGDGIE